MMNPPRSHGRLQRLVSSSLPRATPPINHLASASRTYCSASRGKALQHREWPTCFSRTNSSSYPGFSSHIARQAGCRSYSSSTEQTPGTPEMPDHLDEKEKAIFRKLTDGLQPTALEVKDVSGGCGSMYAVSITSEKFRGLAVIKQHRLVNEILGEDIKKWHGVQLRTKAP